MILVIDNYDSFTYNLVQVLVTLTDDVEVVRNDVESVDDLLARSPRGIVLSPGPGRPENAGVCVPLIRAQPSVPLLGVCLGHQSLGQAYGAQIRRAPVLMHGKTSDVSHEGAGILEGLPEPFVATRYHSLEVGEETLPDELEPVAWSDDGTLMAMRHREHPYWGVQFHPESVLTKSGPQLLGNFVDLCGAPPIDDEENER